MLMALSHIKRGGGVKAVPGKEKIHLKKIFTAIVPTAIRLEGGGGKDLNGTTIKK